MRLDGPDLEQLLVRARRDYGPGIRIVKADKVRSGGIGGFFTREHYELAVEVDGPDGETARDAAAAEPTSEIHDIEIPSIESLSMSGPHHPISLLDLADAISDREVSSSDVRSPSAGPALSTDGSSFASILAGLTETVGEVVPAATAARGASAYGEAADLAEVLEPFVAARPPMAEPGARRIDLRPARRAVTNEINVHALRDLGVPSSLLPVEHDGDLLAALVDALRAMPPLPQPPQQRGEIFAIVGEGEGAWDAAAELAAAMSLDERALAFVTEGSAPSKITPARRVTTMDQLHLRLERWRKRTTPTIVVVDAPMRPRAAEWNRQVLDVLAPTATWLVVPATRKTLDVAEWADRLGPTDGLIVTEVDASRDPASVLRLGIPVAWLDGRPATARNWAGLLIERLVEAA